ncbi:hypothetical protein D3C75_1340220 [compost metagenome]
MQLITGMPVPQFAFQERHGVGPDRLGLQVGNGLTDLGALDLQERAFGTGHTAISGGGEDA